MQSVTLDSFYHDQTVAIGDVSLVTIVRISKYDLLCAGLEQLLSDTHFAVWKDAFHDLSDLPYLPDTMPILFILDGHDRSDRSAEQVADVKANHASVWVVVLADQFEPGCVMSAWHAGATGFCLTTICRNVLIRSLELVMLAESVIPSRLALAMMNDVVRYRNAQPLETVTNPKLVDMQVRRLSAREAEILCCLKDGSPNKVIALKRHLAEWAVKVHVKAILRKIGNPEKDRR